MNRPHARVAITSTSLAPAAVFAAPARAGALYGDFDPFAATPAYGTTQYADLAGSCNGAIGGTWINANSASFDFTAGASGTLTKAFLPMRAPCTMPGAGHVYGLTLTNSAGEVFARGGFHGRNAPAGAMQVYEIDRFASLHAGQARVHCQTNVGGVGAVWDWGLNGWTHPIGVSHTAAMADFLPALHLAGTFSGPTPPSGGPLPSTAALLAAAGLASVPVRRRRPGAARAGAQAA